jgi:hypothetical protein
MEWQALRITDFEQLKLAGEILRLDDNAAALRPVLYRLGFSWPALIEFANGQDILPPLIWSLRTKNLLPPVPKFLPPAKRAGFLTARLDEAFASHMTRRHGLQAQLHEALAALSAAGITPLLLKGAKYLLKGGVAWEVARPMRDIDLLIRPADAPTALSALIAIGYIPDAPSGLQSHHLPELRRDGQHGVIELHTEALAPAGRRYFATDLVWAVSVPANVPEGLARILPAPWQALHAMLHHQACDDGDRLRNLALRPLWEFACLMQDIGDTGWAQIIEQLNATGGIDLLASWGVQAESIYGLKLPASLPVSNAARRRAEQTIADAQALDALRRSRFLLRQLGRGFSREVMSQRYDVPEGEVGMLLRAKHLRFLLQRYRGQFGVRLLGRS